MVMTEAATPECYINGERFYLYRVGHYEEEDWLLHRREMTKPELLRLLIEYTEATIKERNALEVESYERFGVDVREIETELTQEQEDLSTRLFHLTYDETQAVAERAGFVQLMPLTGCWSADHSHEDNLEHWKDQLGG